MKADLHTHTTFSDGALKAETLVKLAHRTELTHLAVSDHDSMHSVVFGYEKNKLFDVELIPATELTAFDTKRNRRVHLLCYYPDKSEALKQFCAEMAKRRNAVCRQSLDELKKLYLQFDEEMAYELCADSGVLYKTHLIRVLYELGYTDGIYKDLYKELFGSSGGKVLHNPQYESVEIVLEIIRESRGIAVLAHPSVYKSMDLVKELVQKKWIDGVEIEHPKNNPQDKSELYQLAAENDLLITGGSDFHGIHSTKSVVLGQCTTGHKQIKKLLQAVSQKKGL